VTEAEVRRKNAATPKLMSIEPSPQREEQLQPMAGVLAFVFPGLGHAYLGQMRRGVFISIGVLGLFFGGLLVAGLSAVDSGLYFANRARAISGKPPHISEGGDAIWFAGQMFVGPVAFGVDAIHQFGFKIREPLSNGAFKFRPPLPDEARDGQTGRTAGRAAGNSPSYRRAIARVAEVGTLACMLAGLLNLIAIIDASWHATGLGPFGRKSKKREEW